MHHEHLELAKVLTPENRDEVLPRFFHRSKREAMEITAQLRPDPAPPQRDVVTKVAQPTLTTANVERDRTADAPAPTVQPANQPDANSERETRVTMSQSEERRAVAVPLTADLRRLHVTVRVEFDHIHPRALGGPSTVENVRIACKVHNQHAARLVFGYAWMDQFTRRKERPREEADAPPAR